MISPIVYIVCSDKTRNGKTLLARLYTDLLSLRSQRKPLIFDTDLSGNGICNYFPDHTKIIDLSRVGDQVAMFDTMLAGDERDFVVDVAANETSRFFRIFTEIGFETGAQEVGLEVQICYLLDWSLNSLKMAAYIRQKLSSSRFVAVRNLAVEEMPIAPRSDERWPEVEIDLYLARLGSEAARTVQAADFSFADFISEQRGDLAYEVRAEIWNFLEDVYNQTKSVGVT